MKRILSIAIPILLIMTLSVCTPRKPEKTVFEKMSESPIAKVERSDGEYRFIYTSSEMDSFISLCIEPAKEKPTSVDEDWLYRITFNPPEKVINAEVIEYYVYPNYLQIGSEYYLPEKDVSYESILECINARVDYFFDNYKAE